MTESSVQEHQSWLVLRAQSGSHEALSELFKSVQDPLFRYISSLVNDRALAEDVLQEVFIRIYRKLKWLKEPAAFRSWTYQIATREVFRLLKRERHWKDQVRDEKVMGQVSAVVTHEHFPSEMVRELPAMISNLPPHSRAVIVLRYLHEMSLVETAAVLGIPLGTVKSRLSYGLQILRRQFNQHEI